MKLRWLVLAALTATMYGQGIRYDSSVTQPASNVPPGAAAAIYTVPNAIVTVCSFPIIGTPCTNTVPLFQDQALTIVQDNPIQADAFGRFGFWVAPGVYSYSLQTQSGKNVGNFPLSLNSPPGPPGPGGIGCGSGSCLITNPTGPQTTTQSLYAPSFNNMGLSFVNGLTTFGDSICVYTGATSTATGFLRYLNNQVGPPLNNACISGWWIQGEPMQMYLAGTAGYNGSHVSPPTQGNNPLNLEEGGKNDATGCMADANCNMNSQLALTTVLTHRGTNNIVQSANAATTGTWTTDSELPTAKASTTNGSTLTFTITTYGSSAIGVTYKAFTSNGGTASVKIDGSPQVNGIIAGGFNGAAINLGLSSSVFTNLYPVAAGSHTVVITVTSATGSGNVIAIPDIVSATNPAANYAPPFIGTMEIIPYLGNANPTWGGTLNTMKQALAATLKGYGFNVQYLPIVNVPCVNGASGCTGGFNSAAYIGNQPGVFNPDGLSCAGSTSDTVHPNDCGHQEIFQAIQQDLGIVQSFAGPLSPQNIYTASHTMSQGEKALYFSGSGLTLTLPQLSSPSGPYIVNNIGSSDVAIVGATGTSLIGIPSVLHAGQSMVIENYDPNWFIVATYSSPAPQNIYTANHTLATSDAVVFMSGTGLTLTLPSAMASSGPYFITNSGTAAVTITTAGVINNVPTTLLPSQGIVIANNGPNWWELSGTQSVTTATPTVGQAACVKAAGPPVVIGYCSTVVGAGGACTCN
jgi:hypothetical protein